MMSALTWANVPPGSLAAPVRRQGRRSRRHRRSSPVLPGVRRTRAVEPDGHLRPMPRHGTQTGSEPRRHPRHRPSASHDPYLLGPGWSAASAQVGRHGEDAQHLRRQACGCLLSGSQAASVEGHGPRVLHTDGDACHGPHVRRDFRKVRQASAGSHGTTIMLFHHVTMPSDQGFLIAPGPANSTPALTACGARRDSRSRGPAAGSIYGVAATSWQAK